MCRSIRLLLVLLCVLGSFAGGYAQSSVDDYDPDDVIDALMLYPLQSDDLFWQGGFEEESPDDATIVRQVQIRTLAGIITFRVFDSKQSAESSIHVTTGQFVPLAEFVDVFESADPNNSFSFDELVLEHRREISGKDAAMFGVDGSYRACVVESNVVVCGFDSQTSSSMPSGGAIAGALVGLGLLLEVANPPITTSSEQVELPEAEATSTKEPTGIPDPIPTQVLDVTPSSQSSDAGSTRTLTTREKRIAAAAVQIAVMPRTIGDDPIEASWLPTGSGTIVSPNGLILTSAHVVEGSGDEFSEHLLILTSGDATPPEPQYFATVIAADQILDLAVLQIVGDSTGPVDPEALQLPYLSLGDSNAVLLGEPIDIYGYQGTNKGVLTFTRGVVTAFPPDQLVPGRAWIDTGATIALGRSGGTAVNQLGELIGIPATGTDRECHPGDSDRNGSFDGDDLGCIPVGGSLGLLRPSNLAHDLLREAGWSPPLASDVLPTVEPVAATLVPFPTATPTPTPTATPLPTATPEPTATPRPTRTPIPTPTPIPQAPPPILPNRPPLQHEQCFGIVDDGAFTQQDVVDRLSGAVSPEIQMQRWGWQGGVYRTFGCDGPPDGDAGWIEINIHRFADASSAQEAVDYFAAARASGTALISANPPELGDRAAVLSGPAWNGSEFTIYVSEGPLLVRVTGVAPTGIPFMNVLAVAQSVLADNQEGARPVPVPDPPLPPTYPASAYLPASPAVNYAECFTVQDRGTYSYSDVISALERPGASRAQVDSMGWIDGAYVVFTCADAPFGRATQIDVVVHQFRAPGLARPYFDTMYQLDRNASRACDHAQQVLVCVSARSESGSPLSDVHFVLSQVMNAAR